MKKERGKVVFHLDIRYLEVSSLQPNLGTDVGFVEFPLYFFFYFFVIFVL